MSKRKQLTTATSPLNEEKAASHSAFSPTTKIPTKSRRDGNEDLKIGKMRKQIAPLSTSQKQQPTNG